MCISANKVKGIRAVCVSEAKSAQMAREHNDAQILCLGARIINEEAAAECLEEFLKTKFDDSHPRHKRRIDLIHKIENGE
jgi:ribose 5-phosphate isomerase B